MEKHSIPRITELQIRKRKLPHWELSGSYYFITFTTVDGVTLNDTAKDIVFSSIQFYAGSKYDLHACVVMETHAHVLLKPLEVDVGTPVLPATRDYSLAKIMHGIKSYSAHRIRRLLGIEGSVWLNESYDRIVRDEAEYLEKLSYIVNNPLRAGHIERPEAYRWLYYEGSE